jgi:inner membrane protein
MHFPAFIAPGTLFKKKNAINFRCRLSLYIGNMDSLTHITVGACLGEAFFGKVIGRKAMVWGALAHSIPDLDFVSAAWHDTSSNLIAHRGVSHSFIAAVFAALILAWLAGRFHRPHNISYLKWTLFFVVAIFAHLLLDAMNNYGIGWFEPFSHSRTSFNTIYVVDPFFTVWFIIATIALLILNSTDVRRKFWWLFGMILGTLYLGYCTVNKVNMDADAREITALQHVPNTSYLTTPTPLNNWLWFVLSGDERGYYVGYRSVFDEEKKISFTFFPRNDSLLDDLRQNSDVQNLIRFSQGFYTVEKWGDTLVFNDLRFGQIVGWHDPKERFVFHYLLTLPDENTLVVQRGRFARWNKETTKSLIRKIRGKTL